MIVQPTRPRLEQLEERTVPSLTLLDSTFFGGPGDQRALAVTVHDGSLYVSGDAQPGPTPAAQGLVFRYPLTPQSGPLWTHSLGSGSSFDGLAVLDEGVFASGYSYGLTSDPVGDKETKPVLTQFDGDGLNWVAGSGGRASLANFFAYSGVETFRALTGAVEDETPVLYAAGYGQPASYFAYLIAKYDAQGNRLAAATDSSVGVRFDTMHVPSQGASAALGVATHNGLVYVVGVSNWPHENDNPSRPALWIHDADLNLIRRVKDTEHHGYYQSVRVIGDALYAVGSTSSQDFLLARYDLTGNRLWSVTAGGAEADELTGVVGVGNQVFAVGHTRSEGVGGSDVVVLEIDPNNGAILSRQLFGGAADDQASAAATDGVNLFVVGESRSFTEGGNATGEKDGLILRYALSPPAPPVALPEEITLDSRAVAIPVLANDTDFDPTRHSIMAITHGSHGTVTLEADGSLTYTLTRFMRGRDSFTYTIGDGTVAMSSATVTVAVRTPPLDGIDLLRTQVEAMDMRPGPTRRMMVRLDVAEVYLNQEFYAPANRQLASFVQEVTIQKRNDRLDVEQANDLIGQGNANRMLVKLDAAQQSMSTGDNATARQQLAAFIDLAETMKRKDRLDALLADELMAQARALRDSL